MPWVWGTTIEALYKSTSFSFTKARRTLHCTVLPPGEFNSVTPILLTICHEDRSPIVATKIVIAAIFELARAFDDILLPQQFPDDISNGLRVIKSTEQTAEHNHANGRHWNWNIRLRDVKLPPARRSASELGLCESSFLLLEYSIEYLIEYSSTRWIPEVAIDHRVVQNKRIPGSSFKFVV